MNFFFLCGIACSDIFAELVAFGVGMGREQVIRILDSAQLRIVWHGGIIRCFNRVSYTVRFLPLSLLKFLFVFVG